MHYVILINFITTLIFGFYAKKVIEKISIKKNSISIKKIVLCSIFHSILFVLLAFYIRELKELTYLSFISSIIMSMSFIDEKEKVIPNTLLLLLFLMAIMSIFFFDNSTVYDRILASLLGSMPLLIVLKIKENSVGSGDIYFLAIVGFIIGYRGIFIVMSSSYFLAFLVSVYMCVYKNANAKSEIAMIPFFYIGYLIFILIHYRFETTF